MHLYTAGTPNGRKVSIALEELGLDYDITWVHIDKEEQMTPEFLALNPNHKIPVFEDDGQVIWESGAILLHLGERHDPDGLILPKDAKTRMDAIQYAFFQTGGIGPTLGRFGAALRKEGDKNLEMIQIFGDEMKRLLGVIDRILEDDREYLAGPYSIGDIMHFPWLQIVKNLGSPEILERERVSNWLSRIEARPAVKKGMAIPE
jgi:GST-like protein